PGQGRPGPARPRRRAHQGPTGHPPGRDRPRSGEGQPEVTTELEVGLYIFILAGFLGYHLITRVPPLLHTPLMSATNAMSGISLIGSLVVTGAGYNPLSTILGTIAVACSCSHVSS